MRKFLASTSQALFAAALLLAAPLAQAQDAPKMSHDKMAAHGKMTKGDKMAMHDKMAKGDKMAAHDKMAKGDKMAAHDKMAKDDKMSH